LTVFISKSSWELVELPELPTGEVLATWYCAIDALLDALLALSESTMATLSTSLPFTDISPPSIGVYTTSPP
jgi:hypothetical protein